MKYLVILLLVLVSGCVDEERMPETMYSTVRPYTGTHTSPLYRPHVIVIKQYDLGLRVCYDDPNLPEHIESYSGRINWVVDLNDICSGWLSNNHLADLNNDGNVDFIDLAKFQRERK